MKKLLKFSFPAVVTCHYDTIMDDRTHAAKRMPKCNSIPTKSIDLIVNVRESHCADVKPTLNRCRILRPARLEDLSGMDRTKKNLR